MTTTKLHPQMTVSFAVIALSLLTAARMDAQCAAMHKGSAFAPDLRSVPESLPADQDELSDGVASPDALDPGENDSNISVLGLWKKIYFAGGALNDVGFAQFNAGGTELLNDVGTFNAGNNFCIGAWKKVGPRRYKLVHTFFVFDDSGKKAIAVGIEKSSLTVSRDGNTFTGRWTQDNFDFFGNLQSGSHFEGKIYGTRIAPGLAFPFPFPF